MARGLCWLGCCCNQKASSANLIFLKVQRDLTIAISIRYVPECSLDGFSLLDFLLLGDLAGLKIFVDGPLNCFLKGLGLFRFFDWPLLDEEGRSSSESEGKS